MEFDKITEETLKDEPDEALLNLHRHLHGRAAQGECREREHGLVAAEMGRRGMQHDSGLECRKGLSLPAPHGYLLWKGKQTAVAFDCKGLPLDQPLVAVCNGEAYGVATLGQPAEMALSEFDRVEWTTRHCVRPEERRAWWPEARKLFVYPLKDWQRYDQPRLVCAPCDGQGLVEGVAFKEYQPPTDRERQVLAASEKLPRQIVLTPRAVSLTGSTLYGRGRQPRDVDVVLVGAEWRADEDQFVVPLTPTFKEKLERAFRAVYQTGNRVQYISEGQGPTFDHLPLYALALVRLPRLEIERVSEVEPEFAEMGYDKDGAKALTPSALERKLRGASEAVRRQALESYEKDEVKPGRMCLVVKPLRPAKAGERQTVDKLFDYVEEHLEYPLLVSSKRDGATHLAMSDGERVWLFSDDGEDNTKLMPRLVAALKENFAGKSFAFVGEVEKWVDGEHYPREAAVGDVKAGRDEGLVFSAFRALYWDGEDLHARPFSETYKLAKELKWDSQGDGKLDASKPLNLVPQHEVKDLAGLKETVLEVAYKPGVEGVVVARADGAWPLDGEPGDPPTLLKWHKSFEAVVTVLAATETATEGVRTYWYGVPVG